MWTWRCLLMISLSIILIFCNKLIFIIRSIKDIFFWNKNLKRIMIISHTAFSFNLNTPFAWCDCLHTHSWHTYTHTRKITWKHITQITTIVNVEMRWWKISLSFFSFLFFNSYIHQGKIIKSFLLRRGGTNIILKKKLNHHFTNYINPFSSLFSMCFFFPKDFIYQRERISEHK